MLDLEAHLQRLNATDGTGPSLKLGSFSAASNITGVMADTVAIRYIVHKNLLFAFFQSLTCCLRCVRFLSHSALLHRYGALAMFDYATAAPYVNIDMNPNYHSLSQVRIPVLVFFLSAASFCHVSLSFYVGFFWVVGPSLCIVCDVLLIATQAPLYAKDAIVLSPHKFIGGVSTPGIAAMGRGERGGGG